MKRLSLFFLLVVLLAFAPGAHAQGGVVQPQVTDSTWQARYWNNTTLSGEPVLTRSEGDPAYGATTGSFAPGVAADNFSARFEKYIDVPAGTYRFRVTADDGVRVTVDNRVIIDRWVDQSATTYSADLALTQGYHYVVVDYYDRTMAAQLQLTWGPVSSVPAPGPWSAAFWNNISLSGNPAASTTVNEVNFDWGTGAPYAGISADNFSARFTRTVAFEPGTYRFHATTDDGMRLFVAGRPVIDQWRQQAVRTYTYDIYLPGGPTEVRVESFEQTGNAVAKVRWEKLGATPPPPAPAPGEVIVEDGGPGFVTGGAASGFRRANEGSGGRLLWTRNNQGERPNYNWARWYPSLAAGRYEIFAYIPYRYTTTTSATYWISHSGGFGSVKVNQDTNGDRWVSLGTYTFAGNSSDYVSLNDITGERYLSKLIAFDAMKFVPR